MKTEIEEIKQHLYFLTDKIENFENKLKQKEQEKKDVIEWEDCFIVIYGNFKYKGLTASFHPTEQHAQETFLKSSQNEFFKSLKVINLKQII